MNSWLRIALVAGALVCVAPVVGLAAVMLVGRIEPPLGYGDAREAEVFADCEACPEMLPIAPGTFTMGENPELRERLRERLKGALGRTPLAVRRVHVAAPFAIGRYEVTFDEWDACVADGGCGGYSPPDEGWGRGRRPVIHVSWNDAQAYVAWLSARTGERYRLPTNAEWEYAARSGVRRLYGWGREASHDFANYGLPECCEGAVEVNDQWENTAPVGQFEPNRWGVHDVAGNVYEWVEDCFVGALPSIETDAAAILADPCDAHVMRGGAWYSDPDRISLIYNAYQTPDHRHMVIGFRVVRDL